MDKDRDREVLEAEIKRGNFVRAVQIAVSLGLPETEIQDLRINALWKSSAISRNAPGTKRLALQYGLSMEKLGEILKKKAEQEKNEGNGKVLEPCYNQKTGRYLSFEKWVEHLFKSWKKLPGGN